MWPIHVCCVDKVGRWVMWCGQSLRVISQAHLFGHSLKKNKGIFLVNDESCCEMMGDVPPTSHINLCTLSWLRGSGSLKLAVWLALSVLISREEKWTFCDVCWQTRGKSEWLVVCTVNQMGCFYQSRQYLAMLRGKKYQTILNVRRLTCEISWQDLKTQHPY